MSDGPVRSGVKLVVLITKRDDLSREEFLSAWQEEHPVHVWRLPGLRRYVQNPSILHRRTWPYDGVAELWFDSVKDVAIAFDSPAGRDIEEREQAFIASTTWLLTSETEVSRA